MAKDYAKLKALAQEIIKCIGDDPEGENPDLPTPDNAEADGGQEANISFLDDTRDPKAEEAVEGDSNAFDKQLETDTPDSTGASKKKKDSALAMMGSVLASKFKK
jgi:hypothetical protein